MLPPLAIDDLKTAQIAILNNLGHLLVFPACELPILSKGKGNKMMNIATAKFTKGEEHVIACTVLTLKETLVVQVGKRSLKLKNKDLQHYCGDRAKRGLKLPRGYQKAESLHKE